MQIAIIDAIFSCNKEKKKKYRSIESKYYKNAETDLCTYN